MSGALVSCVSAPEQDLYQRFATDPGGLPLSPTDTLILFVSTEAVPVETAATSRTAVAGIKDRKMVVQAFVAGLEAAREDAGCAMDPASIQVADAEITAACVTGLTEPEAPSGIRQAVVDVTRPACAAQLLASRARYIGLIGAAVVKSTHDDSDAGASGVLLGWDTSHAFWMSTHLLDAGTGATVCSRSQSVGASSGGLDSMQGAASCHALRGVLTCAVVVDDYSWLEVSGRELRAEQDEFVVRLIAAMRSSLEHSRRISLRPTFTF